MSIKANVLVGQDADGKIKVIAASADYVEVDLAWKKNRDAGITGMTHIGIGRVVFENERHYRGEVKPAKRVKA